MDRFFCYHCFIAVGGLFWSPITDFPNTGEFLSEDKIVGADVAWILAAAGLVLLMTPGLSFSTEEW
jgi:Amt family ammonium transporter